MTFTVKRLVLIAGIATSLAIPVMAHGSQHVQGEEAVVSSPYTTHRLDSEVSKQEASSARQKAKQIAQATQPTNESETIKQRLLEAWGNWQPEYSGWLEWSSDLYDADATINAIGGDQKLADYQKSMAAQRQAYSMEMGPILQMTVEDRTATLVYTMYLTSKETGETQTMLITEFNKFEKRDNQWVVTRLDLYTDGGGLSGHSAY